MIGYWHNPVKSASVYLGKELYQQTAEKRGKRGERKEMADEGKGGKSFNNIFIGIKIPNIFPLYKKYIRKKVYSWVLIQIVTVMLVLGLGLGP